MKGWLKCGLIGAGIGILLILIFTFLIKTITLPMVLAIPLIILFFLLGIGVNWIIKSPKSNLPLWRSIPYWLKGGLIGLIIGLLSILQIFGIVVNKIYIIKVILLPFSYVFMLLSSIIPVPIVSIIFPLIFYFLIGALIGLIIGKIKSKK